MQEEKDAQLQWQRGDEKACCTILGSLNNVLQQQHMDIVTTYEILLSLQEMFDDKGKPIRQAT